jgi:hypothetical protein
MIPAIPRSITLIIVVANLAAAVAAWWVISRAADRNGRLIAGILLGGWVGAALLLAPAPASLLSRNRFFIEPLIPIFALGSFVTVSLLYSLAPRVRHLFASASLPGLIAIQLYRAVGFVFIVLLAQGQLPAHFAKPAGWGDVLVGLTAPFVALAVARELRGATALAVVWNAIGLLDLFVAVGMGTGFLAPLLAPGLGPHVPPAAAMGVYPMILVPTFAVPLSVILHVLALARLRHSRRLGAVVPAAAH